MVNINEVIDNIGYPELDFEISESNYDLDTIIKAVEAKYPDYTFNRTESRYISCVMAIFEHR